MFIREIKKQNAKKGKTFCQYQLAQTSRVDGKVKQNNILYLGSNPDLADKQIRKEVLDQLQSKIFGQSLIFDNYSDVSKKLAEDYYQRYLIKYDFVTPTHKLVIPSPSDKSDYQAVDIDNFHINNTKTFGTEHLCKQISERLDFEKLFLSLGFNDLEIKTALISIISRAVYSASEYKTSQWLEDNSSLKQLYNISTTNISHQSLYSISDKLYQNKTVIDKFLYNRILNLFDIDDTLVIYDLSNTHFEGRKSNSTIAQYGKNKQKRNDCKQVVFTGIINSAGFIRHSRIYEGNTADISTLEDMITDLELHNGKASNKTIVMDAGFASEDNLEFLTQNKYQYVCVSRTQLKEYPTSIKKTKHIVEDKRGNKIELALFEPENYKDIWMCVKSEQKRVKEQSITDKLSQRFEQELQSIANALTKKGGTKKIEKVWERIGRAKEKNRNISGKYIVEVIEENGFASQIKWHKKNDQNQSENKHGVYFIRTNIKNPTEKMLWDTYNTVREVEASFKCLKSDLNIRPVHHQKDERIESHIYLTILAYQLVNTIRFMLKDKNIYHDWCNIVRIMSTQTLQDVVMPMKTKLVKLSIAAKPIDKAAQIYNATNTKQMIPRKKKYVVYH